MKIQKINNTNNRNNFCKVILHDGTLYREPFISLNSSTAGQVSKTGNHSGKPSIESVIRSTYNTPQLMEEFNLFVDMQKRNPVHIYLDVYKPKNAKKSLDSNVWRLKATVAKWFVFKQKSNPLLFLENAGFFADDFSGLVRILKSFGYKR